MKRRGGSCEQKDPVEAMARQSDTPDAVCHVEFWRGRRFPRDPVAPLTAGAGYFLSWLFRKCSTQPMW